MTDTHDDYNPADGDDQLTKDQQQRERLRDLNADGTARAKARSIAKLLNERSALETETVQLEARFNVNAARRHEIDNQIEVLREELTERIRAQVVAEVADSHWTRLMFKMKDEYGISESMVRRFSQDAYGAMASFLTYHGTDSRERRREQHEWAADVVPMWREARRRNGRRLVTPEAEIVPVYPEELEDWDLEAGPLPRAYWSTVLPDGPYYFEYRRARTPEEMAIAQMELPPAPSWDAMLEYDTAFGMACRREPFEFMHLRPAIESIREHLNGKWDFGSNRKNREEPPEDKCRAWLFLLVGQHLHPSDIAKYFGLSYFDGLCLPCPATGDDVIRKLVCTYE